MGHLGVQRGAWELPGAVQLGVLGPGPGLPLLTDSIHRGHDGQLVGTRHYTALTATLDAANMGVCGSCDGQQQLQLEKSGKTNVRLL